MQGGICSSGVMRVERRVLITGFEPFGGERVNPALEAVRRLDGRWLEDVGVRVIAGEVPTVFRRSVEVLAQAIERVEPDVVICVGQAGGRSHITPERVAINVDDARIPDNAGQQPVDEPIVQNGPAAYFSTLPIKRIVSALREAGIPATVSNTAGTYVCNHLFYGLMHLLHTRWPRVRGGFIHIPYLPQQVVDRPEPSMALETIVEGLEIAIRVSAQSDSDIRVTGGAEC
jgi:pyroglutamyl-peptidase